MDIDEYQKWTESTRCELKGEGSYEEHLVYGLVEEVGEVMGVMKRRVRDGWDSATVEDKLVGELGDVLWYLSQLALAYGITMSEILAVNMMKLEDRKKRGVLHGEGDVR